MQFDSILLRDNDMEQTNTLRIPQTETTENENGPNNAANNMQQDQSFSRQSSP